MTRTGIAVDLDVSGLVSGAGRGREALAALEAEIKKANAEGRGDDAGKLAYEKQRLEGRNAGFERDIGVFTQTPQFQSQTASGGSIVQLDPKYANAIKSLTDSLDKLNDKYTEAIKSGDVPSIQNLSSGLDRQQDRFHSLIDRITAPPIPKTQELFPPETGKETEPYPPEIRKEASTLTGSGKEEAALTEHGKEHVSPQSETQQEPNFPPETRQEPLSRQSETRREPYVPQSETQREPSFPPETRQEPLSRQSETQREPNFPSETRQEPPSIQPARNSQELLGDFISGAEKTKEAIRNLDAQIEKAKSKNDPKVGQLYYTREKLKTSSSGFEQDIGSMLRNPKFQQITDKQASGRALSKSEEKYLSQLDTLKDALKKNTDALLESAKSDNAEEVSKPAGQVSQNITDFHKLAGGEKTAGVAQRAQNALQAVGAGQIVSAVTSGLQQWVGSLDRSGIVNQFGSGDILGGRVSEERRKADFWGGIAQTGGGIVGTVAGAFLGNPILGGTLGAGAGSAINSWLHAKPNQDATDAAYAGLWQNRSGDAMELAALSGDVNNVRGAFKTAADVAVEFGYSAEEGMNTMQEVIRQGASGSESAGIARQVLQYERNTGADRGTLTSVAAMSSRYGMGNALDTGWAGLKASGMGQGQYSEYLRAMQRVMEDGISKGFLRSSEQVVQNLTMLAQMTNNDPLWQGEGGARRLMEMNSGLEGTTGLQSASDIIAFRAAQNISGEGGSYIDAMKILEGGLTPQLFKEYMNLTSRAEGGGKEGTVERMRQTFGLNYTNADALYEGWQKNPNMSGSDLQSLINANKGGPEKASSPELQAAQITEAIKNWWTMTGMKYWDEQLPKLREELRNAIKAYNEKTGSNVPLDALKVSGGGEPGGGTAGTGTIKGVYSKEEMHSKGKTILNGFFDTGLLFPDADQKKDKNDRNKIADILDSAVMTGVRTGDQSQIKAASDVFKTLEAVPKDVRERWNEDNTLNSIADSSSAEALLAALNRLIAVEEEKGNMKLVYE